jgi:hypothetical protein
MNYGRYFRLNQALSKVADGVAIYDYVDLPAYFGPSEENPMSPKYPISVTITSDTVSFRLHYSAFKLDKSGDCDFPQYAYDKDDIDKKALKRKHVDIGMAHMEEVVLELPFAQVSSSKLSDTIKSIYNSTFPQVIDENTSMGGRYLEQLIKKRFPVKKDEQSENNKDSVEDILYKNLRKVSDGTASYSTLWLMDLVREGRIYLYSKQRVKDDKTKKEKEIDVITGFLRKLLLDFMFDLKHSDVFQNSTNYQKMYSGLMSDFYFSALMHKCEYYYYRKLTEDSLSYPLPKTKSVFQKLKAIKDHEKRISDLYLFELHKSEKLWIDDLMNPYAEILFERYFSSASSIYTVWEQIKKWFAIIGSVFFERLTTNCWPSWFAEPEEEMRRVCFPTLNEGYKQICNVDTLVDHLGLEYRDNKVAKIIVNSRNANRERISRWFLKRYDFNDVFHLHLFKHVNLFFIIASISFLSILFMGKNIEDCFCGIETFIKDNKSILFITTLLLCVIQIIWLFLKWSKIALMQLWLTIKRIMAVSVFLWLLSHVICLAVQEEWTQILSLCVIVLIVIMAIVVLWKYVFVRFNIPFFRFLSPPILHPLSCIHLTFPRLVAAITAAWLTISMGFDIYVSFFDSKPMWPTAIVISIVVLGFIMYEINRIMPSSTSIRKVFRSIELLIVSYCISLLAGLVVINFVGEKYLERGGTMDEFYEQYVNHNDYHGINGFDSYVRPERAVCADSLLNDSERIKFIADQVNIKDEKDYSRKLVDSLRNVYHSEFAQNCDSVVKTSNYPVVDKPSIFGEKYHIFIMRDFLIMFSFIAMFWGIFIQMIFTGEKQMTEL